MPGNFLEFVGGSMLLAAIVAGSASLMPCIRVHSLRLLAIFCVTALAVFSNSLSTYLVAIFVIATAVTELEFLQNLAAIIRGNKEFFDYQKSVLPKQSKLSNIAEEVELASAVSDDNVDSESESRVTSSKGDDEALTQGRDQGDSGGGGDTSELSSNGEKPIATAPSLAFDTASSSSAVTEVGPAKTPPARIRRPISEIYRLEVAALDRIELREGAAIERNVKFSREVWSVELDGVLVNEEPKIDKIYEVKYVSAGASFIRSASGADFKLSSNCVAYKAITGRASLSCLVLIFESDVVLSSRRVNFLNGLKADTIVTFRTRELLRRNQ